MEEWDEIHDSFNGRVKHQTDPGTCPTKSIVNQSLTSNQYSRYDDKDKKLNVQGQDQDWHDVPSRFNVSLQFACLGTYC